MEFLEEDCCLRFLWYCAYIVTDAAAQYQKMAVLQIYENVENAHLVEILVEVEYLSLVIVVASLVVELPLGQEL